MSGEVIVAVALGVGAHLLTTSYFYGRLTQKVADLERRVTSLEESRRERIAAIGGYNV